MSQYKLAKGLIVDVSGHSFELLGDVEAKSMSEPDEIRYDDSVSMQSKLCIHEMHKLSIPVVEEEVDYWLQK